MINSVGINLAASGSLNSVINEVIHPYFKVSNSWVNAQLILYCFLVYKLCWKVFTFKSYDEDIGYMGLVAVAMSVVAMVLIGRLLDWTKAF